jgi:hypothetical protein
MKVNKTRVKEKLAYYYICMIAGGSIALILDEVRRSYEKLKG